MNLKEALKLGKLDQFAKEHEIEDPHPDGEWRFWKLFDLMTSGMPASAETSDAAHDEDYDEIQTHRDISKDASC